MAVKVAELIHKDSSSTANVENKSTIVKREEENSKVETKADDKNGCVEFALATRDAHRHRSVGS